MEFDEVLTTIFANASGSTVVLILIALFLLLCIFLGIRISMKILDAEKAYIGVETNKAEAIDRLRREMPPDLPCEVVPESVSAVLIFPDTAVVDRGGAARE